MQPILVINTQSVSSVSACELITYSDDILDDSITADDVDVVELGENELSNSDQKNSKINSVAESKLSINQNVPIIYNKEFLLSLRDFATNIKDIIKKVSNILINEYLLITFS